MSESISQWNSDIFLALLFPLAVIFLGFRLFPSLSWHDLCDLLLARAKSPLDGPFSLHRAYQTYTRYAQLSATELSRMRASYSTLGRTHKRLGYNIGYTKKLDGLEEVTGVNARVTKLIAELASNELKVELDKPSVVYGGLVAGSGDLGRVRESLKHFVRDWSEDGKKERDKIFAPILNVLRKVDPEERADKRVLVPGSGLGRLAWEVSELGFDTTANELSFFMSLAFRFLLSPSTTTTLNQHTVHPYAHWFSHQRSTSSLFRGISFPDAVPRLSPAFHLAECDFLTLTAPPSKTYIHNTNSANGFWSSNPQATEEAKMLAGYDYIVTLFFIDTSLNVLATIEHIHTLLRPGGTWINLGPLLWTGGAQAKVELGLDEVLQVVEEVGFIIDTGAMGDESEGTEVNGKSRTVECEYTGDPTSMMRWTYKAEFWAARKSK